MQFIWALIWQWIKDTQFHKMAASTAAGTSLGFVTMMSVFDAKLEKVHADFTQKVQVLERKTVDVDHFINARKELTDERFEHIDTDLKYLKGAIDVTNQNVLQLSHEIKKGR